jgi:hypothetical protein
MYSRGRQGCCSSGSDCFVYVYSNPAQGYSTPLDYSKAIQNARKYTFHDFNV